MATPNGASTYGDIGWRVGIYAVAQMLSYAEPIAILQKFGLSRPVPKNKGEVVKFRRPVPWGDTIVGGAANSATGSITNWTPPLLTEGVPPAYAAITYQDVQVTLAQYGRAKGLTDKIDDLAEDPVLADQTKLAGEDSGEVMELVCYNTLRAGTNVMYAGGASRATVSSTLSLNLVRGVTRTLRANRARPINEIIGPSINISTRPVEAGYIAVGHSDMDADIRNLTGFTPVAEYGSRQVLCPEELGSSETVRFITSPLFAPMINAGAAIAQNPGLKSTDGVHADVYPMIVFGKEAFGLTPLKGSNAMDIKVLNPNVPRGGDPLGQQGSVGWKAWFACVRLNETWLTRIECAVSDLH